MRFNFQKINAQHLTRSSELTPDDECFFLGDYISGNYDHDMTTFILDFKSRADQKRFNNKAKAIRELAEFLVTINLEEFTIVPVPPSKGKFDPSYDDRLLRALNVTQGIKNCPLDTREFVIQDKTYAPSHDSWRLRRNRPDSYELASRYQLLNIPSHELKDSIIIFDDVITKGSHFKAIKRLLAKKYPNENIYGLFVAQTYFYNR